MDAKSDAIWQTLLGVAKSNKRKSPPQRYASFYRLKTMPGKELYFRLWTSLFIANLNPWLSFSNAFDACQMMKAVAMMTWCCAGGQKHCMLVPSLSSGLSQGTMSLGVPSYEVKCHLQCGSASLSLWDFFPKFRRMSLGCHEELLVF